jgi:eukaryotic-like serine/threonine-protein kinase
MATVHFGRMVGEAGFSRTVAIKRLHDSFAKDPDFIAMFIDEARLAARVQHPNVVTTIDVVEADGVLILVMEYLHGETLSRLVRAAARDDERVPVEIASGIVCDALHGLHAAHEATAENGAPLHLVHRDVSPQNLLVGAEGITRVVDFGVAKAIGQSHVTREGQLKGKLAYMAPEQILGEPVDRRADVYAAGVVLWELLTQASLFAGETEAATLQKALSHTPAPPSSVVAHLPTALDDVVLRALSRDPAMRFATARDMAQALEAAAPVASARRIAEWVDVLAGDRIAARRRRLAEIELLPMGGAETPPKPPEEQPASLVLAGEPEEPTVRRGRRWPLALAALGLVVAMPLAWLTVSSTSDGSTSDAHASSAPAADPAPPPAAPPPSASSSQAASRGGAVDRRTAAIGRPATAPQTAPRKPDGAAPAGRSNCPVRSFVDADGITQFRRDCGK